MNISDCLAHEHKILALNFKLFNVTRKLIVTGCYCTHSWFDWMLFFCWNLQFSISNFPYPLYHTHMHHEVNWGIFVSAETNWKLMGNNIISIMCTYRTNTMCIDCINYRQGFSFWFVFTAVREYANDIQTALSSLLLADKFLSLTKIVQ